MGKKAILISVICSIIVVAVLGVSSLVHVFKKDEQKPQEGGQQVVNQTINEGNNKGSKEDPYYIYNTETFVNLLSLYGDKQKNYREAVKVDKKDENGNVVKDENGNVVKENKLDEYGYIVYEDVKDENGNVIKEPYHFELYNDIDFSGVSYKTLFGDGKAFSGVINGKGFSVKNISVNVTTENFGEYLFAKEGAETSSYAHIGIFGDLKNAVIENITFTGISVFVSNDVYDYVNNNLWNEKKTNLEELTVGTIAACSENSTISANVSATVDANTYGVWLENEEKETQNQGRNFVGGFVGYAYNTSITSPKADANEISIILDGKSEDVYAGGVAGGLFESDVTAMTLRVNVSSNSKLNYYIGGIAGYAKTSEITISKVDLNVTQVETERAFNDPIYISNADLIEKYNGVGGIVSVVRADDETQNTKIYGVTVTSIVDMDCIFGGAVYRVKSADETEENTFVELTNLTVSSDVKALKAYGLGFLIPHTKFEYTENYVLQKTQNQNGVEHEYNIILKGSVSLLSGENKEGHQEFATSVISQNRQSNSSVVGNLKNIYFICSTDIYDKAGINVGSVYGNVTFI